jgi:two-component system invasion response regulator UvrY
MASTVVSAEDPVSLTLDSLASRNRLSARERQVLRLTILDGHSAKEIAALMQISVKTVSEYRARVLRKLGVASHAQLAGTVLRFGLRTDGSR